MSRKKCTEQTKNLIPAGWGSAAGWFFGDYLLIRSIHFGGHQFLSVFINCAHLSVVQFTLRNAGEWTNTDGWRINW